MYNYYIMVQDFVAIWEMLGLLEAECAETFIGVWDAAAIVVVLVVVGISSDSLKL